MLEILIVAGTMAFAVSGALVAVDKRFDLVGVLVLAGVTAVGGGAIRDLVSGRIPPQSLQNELLLWAVAVTGTLVFALHRWIPGESRALYAVDTLGLALFAALGAEAGITAGFGFWGTVFAGTISGVGGGMIRDILAGQVPGVLYRSGDFYASAAAAGAALVDLLYGRSAELALGAGVAAVILVRVGSRLAELRLPVART